MKKIKIDLKPCPFCGGDAEMKQCESPKNFYFVTCVKCHCMTDVFMLNRTENTGVENIKANADMWNRRAN